MAAPLALTAFEKLLLADSQPQHPLVFTFRLQFVGKCSPEGLKQALARTLDRHPLLQATVCYLNESPVWQRADVPTAVRFTDSSISRELPRTGTWDITQEPGIRVSAHCGADRTWICFAFHHVACDGLAATQVIEDFLIHYDAQVQGTPTHGKLRATTLSKLEHRAGSGQGPWSRWLTMPLKLLAAPGALQLAFRRPVPVRGEAKALSNLQTSLPFRGHQWSETETQQLRSCCQEQHVTLNDLFMRDLFLALRDWNQLGDQNGKDEHLRICMPVDLRRTSDVDLPAANCVGFAFLNRKLDAHTSPQALLHGIHRDTGLIKKLRLGHAFTELSRVLSWASRPLETLLAKGRCLSTAVLANLGICLDDLPLRYVDGKLIAGNALLERIDFMPAVRPGTSLALGVLTYAGQLTLAMNYDPAVIQGTGSLRFMRMLIARVGAALRPATLPAAEAVPVAGLEKQPSIEKQPAGDPAWQGFNLHPPHAALVSHRESHYAAARR